MPRTLRQFVLPAVAGSALTLAVVGLMSMTQVLPAGQHVIVSYGPEPRDMVQIGDGAPFVVPPGKIFVLTALGANQSNASWPALLFVNGVQELAAPATLTNVTATVQSIAPGFTVHAGSTVTVAMSGVNPGIVRAWGYLADQ